MERTWRAALERGDKVRVKVEIDWPSGATRPDSFDVTYEITTPSGVTTKTNKSFENLKGKT